MNDDTSPSVAGERSKYQPLTWSEDSEGSAPGSGNELGKQPISVKGWNSNKPIRAQGYSSEEERNKVRFMSARLPATGSKYFQSFEDPSKQPKPILKNSSGYSSGEDLQRDFSNQKSLPNSAAEVSKNVRTSTTHCQNADFNDFHNSRPSTPHLQRTLCGQGNLSTHETSSSASAHDRNANLTNQRKDVYSNSGQNAQPYYQDSQMGSYGAKSTSTNVVAHSVRDNSTPLQNHDVRLPQQSQNMSKKGTCGQRSGQIVQSDHSTFSQQNRQNELQTNIGPYRNTSHSTTDQRKIPGAPSALSQQTIQNKFPTNTGHHSSSSQPVSSSHHQQVTPNVGPSFSHHNIQNGFPTNTGAYPNSSQTSTAQSSSANQQSRSNLGLPFAQRNQNELRKSVGQYPSSSQASFGQNSSSVHPEVFPNQQHQTWPGNNNNVPRYHQFEQSKNSNNRSIVTSSQQNNQNSSSSFIACQAVPSNQNLSPNSPSNGPSSPFYPPPSVVHSPQQSTGSTTSQMQPPGMGSTPPYGSNFIQSNNIHNNQQPLQNMPSRTTRYTPISPSRELMSPVQSINYPHSQAQKEHFPPASQKGTISTNSVPRSSQPQFAIVPQGRVQQQLPYTPCGTSEYQRVPSNQALSTAITQQGTQQNFLPKQSQYAQNVPSYQAQSKGISPKQAQSIPQKQGQNFPTNTARSPMDPCNQVRPTKGPFYQLQLRNPSPNESKYVPTSKNEIPHQNLQLPNQSIYNSPSTSEYRNVPNSQTHSTHLIQSHQQSYPPKQSLYSPTGTSKSPNVPTSQANSTSSPQNHFQQQYISQPPSEYPPSHNYISEYQNVPRKEQYDSTAVPKLSPQSTMAQSLDIIRNTTPSQRLPTGQTSLAIHNNQAQSHPSSNYPNSSPEISKSSTKFQSTQARPNTSQYTPSNQLYSSDDQTSSTQRNVAFTANTPKSPVQTPSIQKSPTKSPRVRSSPMPNAKLCRVVSDVIVHGEVIPGSRAESDLTIFPEGVQRGLRDLCVTKPTSFQANIWAAIIRGRDVFGIPESSSDNVMAYLAPIVTHLAQPATYSKLPLGNGVSIVCPA